MILVIFIIIVILLLLYEEPTELFRTKCINEKQKVFFSNHNLDLFEEEILCSDTIVKLDVKTETNCLNNIRTTKNTCVRVNSIGINNCIDLIKDENGKTNTKQFEEGDVWIKTEKC